MSTRRSLRPAGRSATHPYPESPKNDMVVVLLHPRPDYFPVPGTTCMSSSSSASGTKTIFMAGFPSFANRPFSAMRLS